MAITGVTYDGDYKPYVKREPIPVEIEQELRLGSYIKFGNFLVKVDFNFFNLISKPHKTKAKGIPITEELLFLLGFKIQRNYDWNERGKKYETAPYYFHRSQIPLHESPSPPAFIYRDKKFQILGGGYKECKYLHQYQNLFLAKLGEEMIIDEEKLKKYIEK